MTQINRFDEVGSLDYYISAAEYKANHQIVDDAIVSITPGYGDYTGTFDASGTGIPVTDDKIGEMDAFDCTGLGALLQSDLKAHYEAKGQDSLTYVVVYQLPSVALGDVSFVDMNSGSGSTNWHTAYTNSAGNVAVKLANGSYPTDIQADAEPTVLICRYNFVTSAYNVFVNNTPAWPSDQFKGTTSGVRIGNVGLFGNVKFDQALQGKAGLFAAWNSYLTDDEVRDVDELARNWITTGNAPVDSIPATATINATNIAGAGNGILTSDATATIEWWHQIAYVDEPENPDQVIPPWTKALDTLDATATTVSSPAPENRTQPDNQLNIRTISPAQAGSVRPVVTDSSGRKLYGNITKIEVV